MHFNDSELTVLSIIDLIIVYLFCILQISYNVLTAIYIYKAKNKINRLMLWRAYLFALAPIVYSILPILLVLYLYVPSFGTYNLNYPGLEFALKLIYIHLPPIIIVFLIIISWNIICSIHNARISNFDQLFDQPTSCYLESIRLWDIKTKIVFRKQIYKWFIKMQAKIDDAAKSQDAFMLAKILAKVEGWYVAKRRFEFFWCTKKTNKWIKQYYYEHYITLIFFIQKAYNNICK